jgi:hypothetical protein
VKEIYGEAGLELLLPEQESHQKILDIVTRPTYYAQVLAEVRDHLSRHHSHRARLAELLQVIEA